MEPLIDVDDPDWAAYKNGDESFTLRAAGEAIRRYCGWHIWPSITETVPKLRVGSRGLIMLPSLHVTDVSEVQIDGNIVNPDSYVWFREGYVELGINSSWIETVRRDGPGGGYAPDPAAARYTIRPEGFGLLTQVTMKHGYEEVPAEVKQVAFELVTAVSEIPAGNVTEIQTPGFKLRLSGETGLTLNAGQMERLSGFKLSWTR